MRWAGAVSGISWDLATAVSWTDWETMHTVSEGSEKKDDSAGCVVSVTAGDAHFLSVSLFLQLLQKNKRKVKRNKVNLFAIENPPAGSVC
jgi:hypothetical protein